jgi:hypothetical protein
MQQKKGWALKLFWFQDFCEYICNDIEVNGIAVTDYNRIFIWDNLAVHHCAYMRATVTARAGPLETTARPFSSS